MHTHRAFVRARRSSSKTHHVKCGGSFGKWINSSFRTKATPVSCGQNNRSCWANLRPKILLCVMTSLFLLSHHDNCYILFPKWLRVQRRRQIAKWMDLDHPLFFTSIFIVISFDFERSNDVINNQDWVFQRVMLQLLNFPF